MRKIWEEDSFSGDNKWAQKAEFLDKEKRTKADRAKITGSYSLPHNLFQTLYKLRDKDMNLLLIIAYFANWTVASW